MAKRTILVDSARRELEKHGTETFPMTVNHDDLWSFEGKNVPIHWHNDLEINLIREGEAVFQVYQKSYRVRTGEGFLLNRNVPHSCSSPGNEHVRYSTILVRPDFLYGDFGSDVERKCFQPFLQNSAIPCIHLTGFDENGKEINNAFFSENEFVTDYLSFIKQQKTKYTFECLEDCILISIPFETVETAFDKYKNFANFGRKIAEWALENRTKKYESFLFETAEERYLRFIAENRPILNRISLSHLASYLGIERQSLSRIRSKILSQM